MWFNGREDYKAHLIKDLFWLARLAYFVDIFGMLNELNSLYKDIELMYLKQPLKSRHLRESFKVWKKKFAITI